MGYYERKIKTIIDRRIDREIVPTRAKAIASRNTVDFIRNLLEREIIKI
ncbi:hypothetical protein M2102_001689 [Fusobacterium sp. PH5-7]|nr:hypothetical protein [Fusobacterium sp. PH5-7]MDH6458054.1 hypothetical protein [Fusobacterium sp. PH5-7]